MKNRMATFRKVHADWDEGSFTRFHSYMKSYSKSMAVEGENAFSPGTSSLLYRVTGNQTYRCAYEQQKKKPDSEELCVCLCAQQ